MTRPVHDRPAPTESASSFEASTSSAGAARAHDWRTDSHARTRPVQSLSVRGAARPLDAELKLRVLIVDDDRAVRRLLGRMLERGGDDCSFEISQADSGAEALERMAVDVFDLIISDLCMPGMDGIEMLTRARALQPTAERVLMTAYAELDSAVRAINDAHVTRLLAKPIGARELLDVVSDLGRRVRRRLHGEALEHGVRHHNVELERVNGRLGQLLAERTTALLEGLLSALDYRDTETQWHSRRVALFTRTLAHELGASAEELDLIELGALLHDVGKIGIPDAIMLKPGKLSEDEWEVMRRHPQLGYELLAGIDFLSDARRLVLEHHERWDGGGYPSGLAGESIALGARVFAVADTLDAMTSDRPYRKALPFEVAHAEIVAHAGSQFDPAVVEAFCGIAAEEWHAALAMGHAHEQGMAVSEAHSEIFAASAFGRALRGASEQVMRLVPLGT